MTKGKEPSTILDRLVQSGFPMSELFAARNNTYTAPLADLILASDQILAQSKQPWGFKSLAQKGREDFIRKGNIYEFEFAKWVDAAQRSYAEYVGFHIYYEEEGLLFFVRDTSGALRVARSGDEAYDFVRRLRKEEAVSDLRFTKAPTWAEELFITRANWDAYKLIWHDNSGADYEASKMLKSDAVLRETRRRMEDIPGLAISVRPTPTKIVRAETLALTTVISAVSAAVEPHPTLAEVTDALIDVFGGLEPMPEVYDGASDVLTVTASPLNLVLDLYNSRWWEETKSARAPFTRWLVSKDDALRIGQGTALAFRGSAATLGSVEEMVALASTALAAIQNKAPRNGESAPTRDSSDATNAATVMLPHMNDTLTAIFRIMRDNWTDWNPRRLPKQVNIAREIDSALGWGKKGDPNEEPSRNAKVIAQIIKPNAASDPE